MAVSANAANGALTVTNGRFHKTIHDTGSGSNQVFTRTGNVCRILVASGTGSLDLYDGTDNTGDHIYAKTTTAVGDIYEVMCPMTTGLYIAYGAALTITVTYD